MTDLENALPCICRMPETHGQVYDIDCPASYIPEVRAAFEKLREADKARIAEQTDRANKLSLALDEHNGKIGEQRRRAEAAEARAEKLEGALGVAQRFIETDRDQEEGNPPEDVEYVLEAIRAALQERT